LSQQAASTKMHSVSILAREGVTSTSPDRGRHRVEPRTIDSKAVVATVAVAAGALLATGYQVGNPTTANAAEDGSDQYGIATPVANPMPPELQSIAAMPGVPELAQQLLPIAQAPGLPQLPPEITGAIEQINQWGEDIANQFLPHAPVVRPVNGVITSGYGARWGAMHYGLDFADSIGTPISAVSNGTVIEAGPASGFGLWVRVRHDDGTVSVYGHVNDITTFVGKRVNAGETIATVGNRGYSTGPHLHLEIWDPNGQKVDPARWLLQKGVSLGLGASNA